MGRATSTGCMSGDPVGKVCSEVLQNVQFSGGVVQLCRVSRLPAHFSASSARLSMSLRLSMF